MALLVLAVWGLAMFHCDLEQIPGFEFLACADAEAASHQAADCEQDGCSTVESGFYKLEDHAPVLTGQPLVLSVLCWPDLAPVSTIPAGPITPEHSPPGLGATWQFTSRAALLPRAPSVSV